MVDVGPKRALTEYLIPTDLYSGLSKYCSGVVIHLGCCIVSLHLVLYRSSFRLNFEALSQRLSLFHVQVSAPATGENFNRDSACYPAFKAGNVYPAPFYMQGQSKKHFPLESLLVLCVQLKRLVWQRQQFPGIFL